jgi:hypothetical protein
LAASGLPLNCQLVAGQLAVGIKAVVVAQYQVYRSLESREDVLQDSMISPCSVVKDVASYDDQIGPGLQGLQNSHCRTEVSMGPGSVQILGRVVGQVKVSQVSNALG